MASPLRPCPRAPDFKHRVAQQFDRRAPHYDEDTSYHPPQAARVLAMAALQPGEEVLDVGTGTGLVALPAARLVGPEGRVTGVDLSDAMVHQAALKAAAAGLTNLRLLAADIEECDFSPERFDAILCANAVPFLSDIPGALAQWRRWLKPGGRLTFNAPKGVGSPAYTVYAELAADRDLRVEDPSALFARESAVQQLLAAAGYASVHLESSAETRLQAGKTPQQWAENGWRLCMALPFADVAAALSEEQLQQMRQQYMERAAEVAEQFVTTEGLAEPYTMLWVLATA